MKKVLIALDYGPTAQIVAETGYALAVSMHAEPVLIHVIADPLFYVSRDYSTIMGFTGYIDSGPVLLQNTEELKKTSRKFLERSAKHLGDPTIMTLVKEGDFATTIMDVAKETEASVIVMGSHSHKWMENILLGSVTEKVLHSTTIPLYIIPTKKR
jgi:nucleotide-binding universal stress UspA family protein